MSAADARDLLLTIAPRIETQADEIAALCGHLPLALRLAATAMVKYRNLSPADYVRRLRDQRLQLIFQLEIEPKVVHYEVVGQSKSE